VSEQAALAINGLEAAYGRSQVLFGLSLTAPKTGVVAVLGRNGAGKTTLMKTIMGEMPATGGRVTMLGQDITQFSTEQRARLGIGYVPQ